MSKKMFTRDVYSQTEMTTSGRKQKILNRKHRSSLLDKLDTLPAEQPHKTPISFNGIKFPSKSRAHNWECQTTKMTYYNHFLNHLAAYLTLALTFHILIISKVSFFTKINNEKLFCLRTDFDWL